MSQPVVAGVLIGQAIGDMMGLPYENLAPRRVAKLAKFNRPAFFLGYGVGSDDTEHAGLTFDAWLYCNGDAKLFQKRLASNLRRWFLAGPPGIGLATLKACLKLCFGFPLAKTGVRSAGNGPAMRAAVLGVLVPTTQLSEFVEISTRLTHTDKRAIIGSLLIAELASVAKTIQPECGVTWLEEFTRRYVAQDDLKPLTTNLKLAADGLRSNSSVSDFARVLCKSRGVSGFIAHTVPVAVFAFFRHADDYEQGIREVILAGGDTDTVAAVTGALIGARVGVDGIPTIWKARHLDWPWSLKRLGEGIRPGLLLWPLMLARNVAFFVAVIGHASRRLLPPW